MTNGKLKIHTENVLPIIKKWLYTEREIFLRELISNGCDALTKLRKLGIESTQDPRIDISIDPKKKTLTIADTGIGMTASEVEKYIAQVAFSSAEEFAEKYTNQDPSDAIIGHFGLGFFSAYMVAKLVTIDTLSYQPDAKPALWTCDGSIDYTLEAGSRPTHGTTITLELADDAEEFLDESRLRTLLDHYCAYLPHPIYLGTQRINEKEPLWQKSPSETSDQEYIDFYHDLHPFDADPIFWIHLNVDYPFHLQGILYFPKIDKRIDWSKNHIKLYSNRVFVSDTCKEILPDFLAHLRGAIDSPDIPLNVSRSSLQLDSNVRKLSTHISKKVADRLLSLYTTDPEKYTSIWSDIELIVKLGVLQDDKFYEKVKPALIFKTLVGTHLTLDTYIELHGNKILYTQDPHLPDSLKALYKGKEILIATSPVDSALMNHLEDKLSATFQRIDGALDDTLLDPAAENTLLDADGKTQGSKLASFAASALSLDVEAKSFTTTSLPALLVLDENLRRLRDHMTLTGQALPPNLSAKKTLVLNTQNPLVRTLTTLKDTNPPLATDLLHTLHDIAALSQKEFEPTSLTPFLDRLTRLLQTLTTKI